MPVLSTEDRQALWAAYQQEASRLFEALDLTKADLLAAVNATDQWIDDNAASFNTALPVAARTALSARQKARLFMAVAERRFEVS